jgi:hypothetical protein
MVLPVMMTALFGLFAQVQPVQDGGGAIGFGASLVCLLISGLLGIVSLVAVIWAIVDIVKSSSLDGTEKLIWVIVVLALNLLGVLIYAFVGRKKG